MWGISITMCYFHRFIDDINYSLQDFLITFFELLAWIVLIIGAIDTFPQNKYSNKRVWFYYASAECSISDRCMSVCQSLPGWPDSVFGIGTCRCGYAI